MGWQVGGVCYASEDAAVQAAVSSELGRVVILGSAAYTVDVTAVTASSVTYRLTGLSGATDIVKTVPVTPAPCRLLEGADALILGWSLIGVWVAAYAVKYLANLVK